MPTTSNGDCCVELMQGTLVRPLARYPSSIAGDDPLKVALNRVRTTLVRPVKAGDTLFTVGDASRLVPQMLLSIGSEIISVSSIDGNILTVVRGFDGTFAASHSAGSILDANIVAWHHNVLAAEITAIEQALGVNLENVGGTGGAMPWVLSTPYNFPAQTPGGTLTGGVINQITLTPVPAGVNATDVGHYLYISGGTGSAESVLISGGTAVAGAASGTIFFTPVNNHSGAWNIRSATAGIQEAFNAQTSPEYVCVKVPAGSHTIYGTITMPAKTGCTLTGAAGYSSKLSVATPNIDVIRIPGGVYYPTISALQIQGDTSYTSGWAVTVGGSANPVLRDLRILYIANGIKVLNSTQTVAENIEVRQPRSGTGIGFHIDLGGYEVINMRGLQVVGDPAAKPLSGMDVYNVSSLKIAQSEFMQATYGCRLIPGVGQIVTSVDFVSVDFDNSQNHGLFIQPSGGVVERVRMVNCWAASSQTGSGIYIDGGAGTIHDVSMVNGKYIFNTGAGISATTVLALNIVGNAIYSNDIGVAIIGAVTGLLIEANSIGTQRAGLPPQHYGIFIAANSTDNYAIIGNNILASTVAALQDGATGMNKILKNNIPLSNGIVDLASAGTLDLAYGVNSYRLSGNTPVTKMLKGWANRQVSLINGGSGTINFNTGGGAGGIAGAVILAPGGIVSGMYDATANLWYLK